MELQLKHLAPYLPYGLRYSFDNYKYWGIETQENNTSPRYDFGTLVRVGKETLGYPISVEWDDKKNGLTNSFKFDNTDFKPILRPMSDLDKEITNINGETIVFTSKYKGLVNDIKHSMFMSSRVSFYADYSTIESLLEWHFDVFRLIERGIAIDINTLSPNVAGNP